jgi:BirA family biotin operon repressor/biotin-[acetyl-CoA-carboxylase] ligase
MERLLKILSDGEFHSGEELGKLLQISRTAIWKHMQKVEALGLPVQSQKGCGYRIEGGLDLLNAEELRQYISPSTQGLLKELDIHSSVVSTNALARQRAEQDDCSGLVVLSESQTDGRGRRGRQWVSPYGCNLYLSMVWGFEGGVQALEGLSLAVAVAVQRAVERCGITGLKLKWPNDLLWHKRKIGGVLLEVIGDPSGYCQVIIGVGINLAMPEKYSEEIGQQWANLNELNDGAVARNKLAGMVVDELLALLGNYQTTGFGSYRDAWLESDAYANEPVTLLLMNHTVKGIARGVDSTGALMLEVDGEMRQYSGGEISLRGTE